MATMKTTDIFKILDSISYVEKEQGRDFTIEEKTAMIVKALKADTDVTNKKRHKQ
jgi:hypothetical protein